jgi:HAD superfamily hydrolase (TIGR01490 family)
VFAPRGEFVAEKPRCGKPGCAGANAEPRDPRPRKSGSCRRGSVTMLAMVLCAALFDMDRTLIRKDSAALYTRYLRDIGEASLRDVAQVGWWAFQYTLGVIDAPRVAKKALENFRGLDAKELAESCRAWFKDYVLEHVQPAGRETVERHRQQGDFLAIVTGATIYAAQPLADELGIETVLCSELDVDAEGRLTGAIIDPLCYGQGKVVRTLRVAEREGFTLADAAFYSDSITDVPLLEAVGTPVVVNPDRRLRREAARRGWRVESW